MWKLPPHENFNAYSKPFCHTFHSWEVLKFAFQLYDSLLLNQKIMYGETVAGFYMDYYLVTLHSFIPWVIING